VVIAPATAGAIVRPGAALQLLAAFASFCLMSSATYLVNDVRDRASDRLHPRKRLRPVAAGELSPRRALRAAALLALTAAAIASLERSVLVAVVLGYGALTLSYTLWWRDIVLLDIVAVAGGFVLRAVAGAAAVDVSLSRAFLVVTSACALFLVAGKRYAELLGACGPSSCRATLRRYTRRGLRLLLAGSAVLACGAYTSWSFGRSVHGPWLALSLIPFALWLGRYAALVRAGAGESPEELVLHDNALVGLGLVWTFLFVVGNYGSS
jgi:decaprenyl-phosphate phosphoribosyltransferase